MVFVSTGRKPPAELPEPPWSSKRSKPDARTPLSREAITDAALKIVDAEGLDELSMRRLAEELNSAVSALYAHVSSKAELLQLLIDRVAGEVQVPAPDPDGWEDQLKQVARAMRASLAAHRDLAAASLGNIPTGHNSIAVLDKLLALLLAAGLPRQIAAYAAGLIPLYISASTYEASLFDQRVQREPTYFVELDHYLRSFPRGRFPAVAEVVDELTEHEVSRNARFEFGLDMLVRGLASYAKPRAIAKPERPGLGAKRPSPPSLRQRPPSRPAGRR